MPTGLVVEAPAGYRLRTNRLTVPVLHETIKKYFPLDRYAVVTLKSEA